MREIFLDPASVPSHLRLGTAGLKFRAIVGDTVCIPANAGLWESGSRDLFYAVQISDGAYVELPCQDFSPSHEARKARSVEIPAGVAVVRHSVFMGRDSGLTYYLRADDAAPLLPQTAPDLSRECHIVLACAGGLKSAYRREAAAREGIDAATYDQLKDSLIADGLMASNGSITIRGRNVLAALPCVSGL